MIHYERILSFIKLKIKIYKLKAYNMKIIGCHRQTLMEYFFGSSSNLLCSKKLKKILYQKKKKFKSSILYQVTNI